jgi:hypothetical protein
LRKTLTQKQKQGEIAILKDALKGYLTRSAAAAAASASATSEPFDTEPRYFISATWSEGSNNSPNNYANSTFITPSTINSALNSNNSNAVSSNTQSSFHSSVPLPSSSNTTLTTAAPSSSLPLHKTSRLIHNFIVARYFRGVIEIISCADVCNDMNVLSGTFAESLRGLLSKVEHRVLQSNTHPNPNPNPHSHPHSHSQPDSHVKTLPLKNEDLLLRVQVRLFSPVVSKVGPAEENKLHLYFMSQIFKRLKFSKREKGHIEVAPYPPLQMRGGVVGGGGGEMSAMTARSSSSSSSTLSNERSRKVWTPPVVVYYESPWITIYNMLKEKDSSKSSQGKKWVWVYT